MFRGGVFGRGLGYEVRIFIMGISVFREEIIKSKIFFVIWRCYKKLINYNIGRGVFFKFDYFGILIMELIDFISVGNKCILFISYFIL